MSQQDKVTRLLSIETKTGRYYRSPTTGVWYPSVTTVVNHRDAEKWKTWREDPENAATSKAAIERGNRLHTVMENYLVDGKVPESEDLKWQFESMRPYAEKITEVNAIEVPLWSDGLLLAGRTDCIGLYEGKSAIIDFKTSGKPKRREWVMNYFHQACAYSYMWQERTSKPVELLVILILCDDGSVQEFKEQRSAHRDGMAEVISDFWKVNDFEEIQQRANDAMASIPVR